jgi:ribose transport system permease protein
MTQENTMSTTTSSETKGPAKPEAKTSGGFDLTLFLEKYALVIAWLALIVVFTLTKGSTFATQANWSSILSAQAVIVVLTLGLIIPLTTGDFDLSVAYNLALCSIVVAVLNVNLDWPIIPSIIAAVAVGTFVGFLNGAISLVARIDPIIVTLGMGTFIYGVTLMISDQTTISGVSSTLTDWTVVKSIFGIPIQFYYAIAVMLIVWYVFEFTSVGRRMLIVGRGREVAKLSGLNVNRVRLGALTTAGFLAGVAGVLYTGTSGSADPTSGSSFLLPAFAAAFLGATSIMPGRFNPWGAVIATYFLATGINGLQLMGAQGYVQQLFYGGALIIAVALSQLSKRSRAGDGVAGPQS